MDRPDGGGLGNGALAGSLVKLILAAAVVTAPVFLFGEGFEAKYVGRVAASNGTCIVLCLGLLALLRRGHAQLVGRCLVYGLLALVGALAWFNGEPAPTNVINFVLVTVLAAALLPKAELTTVAIMCATTMVCIAWDRPVGAAGAADLNQGPADREVLRELRFESIVQFLPTYAVVVIVLRLMGRPARPEDAGP